MLHRYSYRRLAITLFNILLYITILFTQKEKRVLYKVFESIMSLAPADNTPQRTNPACARPTTRCPTALSSCH